MRCALSYSTYTDIGTRAVNEDSLAVFSTDTLQCFAVCDGLGGHGMGDVASSVAVNAIGQEVGHAGSADGLLAKALMSAQSAVLEEQRKLGAQKKMKTTAVILLSDGRSAYIGHVGDSRLYIFNHNKVKKRTLDHSVPQMLALSGEIKESDIRHHPDRNSLLRVIGIPWDKPMFELMQPVPLWRCQAFLLCSDGFWENIEEDRMCALLKEAQSVEEWLNQMAAEVKRNGKGKEMDNNSAIAVWKIR